MLSFPRKTKLKLIYESGKIFIRFTNVEYINFKNSFMIHDHEENTKKNHKRVISLYVIEISLDLHKL
jgi:hypothetical protein